MTRDVSIFKTLLIVISALSILATAAAGPVLAEEYKCASSGDGCSVSKSSFSATIFCMKKTETWVCTKSWNGIECMLGSEKRPLPLNFWSYPQMMCGLLCGYCSSGWEASETGGATF